MNTQRKMKPSEDRTDFGDDGDRVAFLHYLRFSQRFTVEDLAMRSLYSVDTVKAWLTDSPRRRRHCSDRALTLLLQSLGLTKQHYWKVVRTHRA